MKKNLPFVFLLLIISPTLAYDDDDDYEGDKHKKWWSTPLIMVVYLGIFLIAAAVSLCIRHFRDRRFLLDFLNNHQREADRGLKAEEIESLPSLRYSEIKSKGRIKGKDELECAICLAEFKEQEVVRILPDCYHVFHPSCIAPWLASHVTCPICRSSLEHKQGSSVSINSILNGISGHLSQRFDQSDSQHDADHDDHHHITIEIEASSTFNSEENLDGHHHPRVTSGTRKLPKSYSTGDITVQMLEKCTSSYSSLSSFMLPESSPKSDYRTTTPTINKNINWSCIFSKSDRFVDYSSLMLVQMKGTVVMSASHESPSSSQSYVGEDRHDGRLVTGV